MAEESLQDLGLEAASSVGNRLRRARETAGLSLGDISARTKIAERHLIAIEEDRLSDLAARTYAVGFSRSYARAVELDETEIAEAVRQQLAEGENNWEAPVHETFEPGDPARVPQARLAWIAALSAIVVFVLLYVFWRSFLSPSQSLPDLVRDEPAQRQANEPAAKATSPQLSEPSGAVAFRALEPDIWVKFYDASGTQLFQKQMAMGETYTVPADADGPQIWTGRPDALEITIGGRRVRKLAEKQLILKDVPVTAKALLARGEPDAAESVEAAQ